MLRGVSGEELQEAIVTAYNSAYGMQPVIQRLTNATGETIRPTDHIRHRLGDSVRDETAHPTVRVVVQGWTDERTLADRLGIVLPWTRNAHEGSANSTAQTLHRVAAALARTAHPATTGCSSGPPHGSSAKPQCGCTGCSASCINLGAVGLAGSAFAVTARILAHATWISCLRLSDNFLSDDDTAKLAHVLPAIPNLTELHLQGNLLTAAGVRMMLHARVLATTGRVPLAALTTLDLSFNCLGNLSASDFSRIVWLGCARHGLFAFCRSLHVGFLRPA